MSGRRARIQAKPNVKASKSRPAQVPQARLLSPERPQPPPTPIDDDLAGLLASPPRTPKTPAPPKTPQQPVILSQPPTPVPTSFPAPHHSAVPIQPQPPPAQQPTTSKLCASARRRFACTTELDRSKFTMADLAYWNPKRGQRLGPQPGDVFEDVKKVEVKEANNKPSASSQSSTSGVIGPRVRVGEDGELVVDEASLLIHQEETGEVKEAVHEGSGIGSTARRISNFSFRRKRVLKHRPWSDEETETFYMCLSAAGSDFYLMKEFIPDRSVEELKRKYRMEHKQNPARVDQAFTGMKRLALDPMLYELVSTKRGKAQRKKARLQDLIHNELIDPRNQPASKAEEALAKNYDGFSSAEEEEEEEERSTVEEAPPKRRKSKTPPNTATASKAPRRQSAEASSANAATTQQPTTTKTGPEQPKAKKSVTATQIKAETLENILCKVRGQRSRKEKGTSQLEATAGAIGHLSQDQVDQLLYQVKVVHEKDTAKSGKGGGNLLLLHERSNDPNVADVIHIYLLQDTNQKGNSKDSSPPGSSPDASQRLEAKDGEGSSGSGCGSGGAAAEVAEVVEFVDVDTVEPEPLRLILHQDPTTNLQYYTTPTGEIVQWVSPGAEGEGGSGGYAKSIEDVVETVAESGNSNIQLLRVGGDGRELPPPPQIRLVKKCRVRSNMAEIPSVTAIVDFVASGGGSYEDLFPAEVAEMEYHDRRVSLS